MMITNTKKLGNFFCKPGGMESVCVCVCVCACICACMCAQYIFSRVLADFPFSVPFVCLVFHQ